MVKFLSLIKAFLCSILGVYAEVTRMFKGILMNDLQREKHEYWIQRLEIRSELLDRLYKN